MATMNGGVQRGSEDFKTILEHFQTRVYKTHNYDTEAIRKSNPVWEKKYERRAFAESIRNILAVLALVPPLKVSTTDPFLTQDTNETMDVDDGVVPGGTADVPSGVEMLFGERLLCTPKHIVAWTDSTKNHNNRITIYVVMPPGHARKHYTIAVDSGHDVVLKYTWPDEMLNSFILVKGHNMYDPGKQ